MSASFLRSTLFALVVLAPLSIYNAVAAETLLHDDFNTESDWTPLSEEGLDPLTTLVVDPVGAGSTDNYVLRFIRKSDARVFRDLSVSDIKGTVTIEFRVLKTGGANTAGLWLVDASGKGTGFFLELNTAQSINRVKVLGTSDSAETHTLIKTFPNIASDHPPEDNIWHKVSFVWDTNHGTVSATIDGNLTGEANNIFPPDASLSRAILHGGFPSTLYLDDVQVSLDR